MPALRRSIPQLAAHSKLQPIRSEGRPFVPPPFPAPGVHRSCLTLLAWLVAPFMFVVGTTVKAAAGGPAGPDSAPLVRLSDVTLFGDLECFRIETPHATYLYGKRGAGFASLLDRDGRDWISYRHGQLAAGEYRGLPKAGQPVKYFHCGYGYGQYATDNPFASAVTLLGPAHVRIRSTTLRGDASGEWDFYPTHATFTLHRRPGGRFWFLYEGTPGGTLDPGDFVYRPRGHVTPLTRPWDEVVPWAAFGASETNQLLLLVNHGTPSPVDSYVSWPYRPSPREPVPLMTVFGFGRAAWDDPQQHTPQLTQLPARFSLGFVSQVEGAAEISQQEAALQAAARSFTP